MTWFFKVFHGRQSRRILLDWNPKPLSNLTLNFVNLELSWKRRKCWGLAALAIQNLLRTWWRGPWATALQGFETEQCDVNAVISVFCLADVDNVIMISVINVINVNNVINVINDIIMSWYFDFCSTLWLHSFKAHKRRAPKRYSSAARRHPVHLVAQLKLAKTQRREEVVCNRFV